MPLLPTLTVTDLQLSRISAVFGSPEAYRSWLRRVVINEVVTRESNLLRADLETQLPDPDAPATPAIGTPMTAPPPA